MFEARDFTLGQANALVKKLGGEAGARAFLRDELVLLRIHPGFRFPVWKSIEIGTHATANDLCDDIRRLGMKVDHWATGVAKHTPVSAVQKSVDLVKIQVATLCWGCSNDGQTQARAEQFGLQVCPPEVGFQLRRQYLDQPRDEVLIMAMNGMPDDEDEDVLSVLQIAHLSTDLSIGGLRSTPNWSRDSDDWLVFIQPR